MSGSLPPKLRVGGGVIVYAIGVEGEGPGEEGGVSIPPPGVRLRISILPSRTAWM